MKLIFKFFLLASFCWLGCMHPGPDPAPAFLINLYYKAQNGDDLLNPITTGSYSKDGIQLTDIVTKNGVATEVLTRTDSCSNYVCQSAKTNLYYVQFFPHPNYEGTLIHHGSVTDTLTYIKVPMNATYGITKIIYKGQILWSQSVSKPTTFPSVTIIK